jgi:H/ACA ribonucleoprotein complex subunit 2
MSKSDNEEISTQVKGISALASIAHPLAGEKLHKKLLKLVKKAAKDKCLKRGVKEVVKAIRKNTKGIVVLAGDISPIDVLSHIPLVCEESKIPYIYVPSKVELGIASATKRATCCILITPPKSSSDYKEYYDYCFKEISN